MQQGFIVRRSAYLAAFAALVLAVGPVLAQDGPPQRGGTIILTLGNDPPTINPVVSTGVPDASIGCILYQGLTRVTGTLEVAPLLAKSWTISPDGKTYSFELTQASWHDGKPFTSADVKWSLMEANAKISPPFAAAARLLESVDAPAPDKVVINLKQPFGPLLISLACGWGGSILPKHVFEGTNIPQNPGSNVSPIGTGAFTLKEWRRGDHLRLVRNPNYWEPGKPYLDEVVAKIIGQPAARVQALQAGEVDFINQFYMPNNEYQTVRDNPKLRLMKATNAPNLDYLAFNVLRKPLDDKRVRQALLMATDRDYLLKNAWLGNGQVPTMPFTSQIPWAAAGPDVDFNKTYPFDIAKANALLDDAGLKAGADGTRFKVRMNYATDESDKQTVASALKGMWRAVGVDVDIEALDRVTHMKKVYTDRDFDVTVNAYSTLNDPALGLARIFTTGGIGNLYANPAGYSKPEVDDLFRKAEVAPVQADRGALYRQVQSILAVDLPTVPLREKFTFNGVSAKLMGMQVETDLYRGWTDAWLAK